MENLFVSYHSIVGLHGLPWIISENQKVAVHHVPSAFYPGSLRTSHKSYIAFAHHEFQKDFKSFMTHSMKSFEAFQLVGMERGRENGKTRTNEARNDRERKHYPFQNLFPMSN